MFPRPVSIFTLSPASQRPSVAKIKKYDLYYLYYFNAKVITKMITKVNTKAVIKALTKAIMKVITERFSQ